MVKFKLKLLFFKLWGGAFAPSTNSVPSPLPYMSGHMVDCRRENNLI
jgi:hypothetical protein